MVIIFYCHTRCRFGIWMQVHATAAGGRTEEEARGVADPHAAALRKISNTEAKKRQRETKVSALRVHEGRDPTRRGGSVAERAGAVGEKRDRADSL